MEDGRKNNGGHSNGGRKPKAEEQKLIQKLSPLNTIALKALKTALKNEDSWAVKLYFEYFYGKPQQRVDVTSNEETLNMPVITFVETETE